MDIQSFLYAVGTVLGVAGALMLRDFRDGKNLFSKNAPGSTFAQGMYMKAHYNDELTATLVQMQIESKDGFRDMSTYLEKINEALIRIESGGVKIRT